MTTLERAATPWSEIRALFPATRDQVYLNTASYGPVPTPVRRAVEAAIADTSEGRGDWRAWEREGERAREAFARILGVAPETVALLPAMSVGAGQVAASLPADGNVVVGAEEFRSNFLPWSLLERRGVEVRRVPFRRHGLELADFDAAVDDRTSCVAVSAVQSATGFRAPLEELSPLCRRRGARLFVDGTQSVGALRLPVELADFVAVSAYKWLLAPRGVAFLYVAPERMAELAPIAPNWKTPLDPYEDYYGDAALAETARRFDVSLGWPVWCGAAESLALVAELGVDRIETRVRALATRFEAGLADVGLEALFAPECSSQIVSLAVDDPAAVQSALRERKVVAAVRHGCLRTSFHFYNDEDDVDRALEALRAGGG